jgi:uncharacterized protein YgbK (DUF1537 family)
MKREGRHILVLADDLTGSNDTGVQFTRRGYRTAVVLPGAVDSEQNRKDVSVVDTESRFLSAEEAYGRVRAGIAAHGEESGVIYKKIDSTMRGNIGSEIRAAMDAAGASLAVVAAAFPATGRTTEQGCCLVNGEPVHETDLANDPRTPVQESDIGKVIRLQYDAEVRYITSDDMESLFADACLDASPQKPLVLVFDAASDEELRRIWELTGSEAEKSIYVGSAGFASWVVPADMKDGTNPVLFVLGSVNQRSIDQAAELPGEVAALLLDPVRLLSGERKEYLEETARWLDSALASGSHAALKTVLDRESYEKGLLNLRKTYGMKPAEAAETIAAGVAEVIRLIVEEGHVTRLYLTGGDIAIHTLERLGVSAVEITAEVASGIPEGLVSFRGKEIRVITKAGGFGDACIIRHVIAYFEKKVGKR